VSNVNSLPFQYALRGDHLHPPYSPEEQEKAVFHEQRDRDLEDFLSQLAQFTGWYPGAPAGAGRAQYYWSSRLVNTNMTATEVQVPVAAAYSAAGFTLQGGSVVCQQAGKYMVTCVMSQNSSVAGGLHWNRIAQWRGATQIVQWSNYGLAAVSGYPYGQVTAVALLDMAVGDGITLSCQAAEAGHTIDGSYSSLIVWPIGGPKGDPGPPGPPGGSLAPVCIARKIGNLTGVTLPGGGAAPMVLYTLNNVTMVAGRLYRVEWTARAQGSAEGFHGWLYRDGAQITVGGGTGDMYAQPGGATWNGIDYSWLIGDAASMGTHSWSVMGQAQAAGTSAIYTDGGYMAIFDLGPDPGAQ
jgi:hypothetical protein